MTRAGAWAGALLVAAGAALFGTVGTAQALGPTAPATALASLRLLLAAVILLALAVPHGVPALRTAWRVPAVWLAGVAQAAFNVTFLSAVSRTGVAVGTLIAIGCTPILTGLFTRRVSRVWVASTSLALLGLVLLLSGDLDGRLTPVGVAFALGASASYAVFIVASASIGRNPVETTVAIAAIFTVAAIVLAPALTGRLGWAGTPSGAAMVAYLAIGATVVAYGCFNRGLAVVLPSTAATLALVEPLVAALLGVIVLDERLSALAWCGAVLVLGALVVMVRGLRPVVLAGELAP
ncbi:MAG: EamA family transporter [Propionibacteriales bacterium]|nr:EamA family transporter [Propionibacteriales bacterium]